MCPGMLPDRLNKYGGLLEMLSHHGLPPWVHSYLEYLMQETFFFILSLKWSQHSRWSINYSRKGLKSQSLEREWWEGPLYLSSSTLPWCPAPVLSWICPNCFHLVTEVTLYPTTPMWSAISSPNVIPDLLWGFEQKIAEYSAPEGQKCTLRAKDGHSWRWVDRAQWQM